MSNVPSFGDYRDKASAARVIVFGALFGIGFYVLLFGMVVL